MLLCYFGLNFLLLQNSIEIFIPFKDIFVCEMKKKYFENVNYLGLRSNEKFIFLFNEQVDSLMNFYDFLWKTVLIFDKVNLGFRSF